MKCVISREELLEGLNFASGVVERRQSMAILADVLLGAENNTLSLVGSDMEIELTNYQPLIEMEEAGKTTVSARKLIDICRSLPGETQIMMQTTEGKLTIHAGKSRFSLATLPAGEFPLAGKESVSNEISIHQSELLKLLEPTYFAMAQQDVRYYLNGMLFEISDGKFTAVATDGHRLAMQSLAYQCQLNGQFIVPRKTILELLRLLSKEDQTSISMRYGSHSLCIESPSRFTFISRLIDGRFPDYHRVIPANSDKTIFLERDALRQILQRTAILTNEKFRAIRLHFQPNLLLVSASNMEQEEAYDELVVDYSGTPVEVGINVNYLLDVLAVMPQGMVKILLTNADSSILIESESLPGAAFVIMPMAL